MSEKRLVQLAMAGPSRTVHVTDDDALPFASLSAFDLSLLRNLPSRYSLASDGSLVYRAKSPIRSNFSLNVVKKTKKPKRRVKRLRSRSPSYAPPTPHLQPQYPYYPPQPPSPPPASTHFSLLSFFSPSIPLLIMVVFVSIGIVALSFVLTPITKSLGNAVDTIVGINPTDIVFAVLAPVPAALASIPIGAMWCNGVGIGCPGPDRNAAFKTESFTTLDVPHPSEQISLGNDFFDCLNDLRITRSQKGAVSHLITLAPKVMQWEHVLESPEELSDNIIALARARRDTLMNANAARIAGSGSVGKIINEFENARFLSTTKLSQAEIQKDVLSGLSSAQQSLQDTADYTIASSQAVKSSADLAARVAEQAHREISRLRRINNEMEAGLEYLAFGWLQPGRKGMKEDRELAGEFLKEVVKVVDRGVEAHLATAMSLQQCAVNTKNFNDQIQKAFSFEHSQLSISSQIRHLVPRIDNLGASLVELRKNDAALRVAGPQNIPASASNDARSTK